MSDWWSDLTSSLKGLLPDEPKPPRPPLDMDHWGPTLEAAGYGKDSAEYKLLEGIGKHVNSVPIPRESTTKEKMWGTGLNALGAGMARLAGASHAESQRPTESMIADWRARRDAGDAARSEAWKVGGSQMIPSVTGAVQTAAQLKRLQAIADQQRQRFGYGALYNTKTPVGSPSGAPGAAPAEPLPSLPGTTVTPPAASPGAPAAPPAAPPPAAPQGASNPATGSGERKFRAGNTTFYTQEWADFFDKNFDAVTSGAAVSVPIKDKDGVTVNQEIKTPADLQRVALQEDEKTYRGSLPYKGREAFQGENIKRSFEEFKSISERATHASKAAQNLQHFEDAFRRHVAEGGTTGPVDDWMTTFKKWATSAGLSSSDTSAMEQMYKSSIQTATQFGKDAFGARFTQSEFHTFLNAVASGNLSTAANLRVMPFLQAQSAAELAIQKKAAEHMEKGGLPFNFELEANAIRQQYAAEALKDGDQMVADWKAGKFDKKPGGGAKKAAEPAPDQKARALEVYKARVKAGATPEQAAAAARAAGASVKPKATAADVPADPDDIYRYVPPAERSRAAAPSHRMSPPVRPEDLDLIRGLVPQGAP